MVPNLTNPFRKKVFRRTHLGAGQTLKPEVRRAVKAARKGISVEIKAVDSRDFYHAPIQRLACALGFWGKPSNLILEVADAFEALKRTPKRSQNVIFSAYMMNTNRGREAELLRLSVPVLKNKGRVVLVLDKADAEIWRRTAARERFSCKVREISDKIAGESDHSALSLRGSDFMRHAWMQFLLENRHITLEEIDRAVAQGKAKSRLDYFKPVLIVMRKV